MYSRHGYPSSSYTRTPSSEFQRTDDGDTEPPDSWPYTRRENCWGRHTCTPGLVKALKAMGEIPEEEQAVLEEMDEREGEVDEAERHRAFNRQSLSTRISVVAAGPLFNFVFAILAYWVMFVSGVPGLRPVVGEVIPASYAEQAGFRPGDEMHGIQIALVPLQIDPICRHKLRYVLDTFTQTFLYL